MSRFGAKVWKMRKWIVAGSVVLLAFFVFMGFFAGRLVEPILKKRLHALIVQGSDSLYTYHLGNLDARVLDGHVELRDLDVQVDSSRYRRLAAAHALPPVTVEIQMAKGYINGLGVLPLLFSKRLSIYEFVTRDANVRFIRHKGQAETLPKNIPLWKAIRPDLRSISIGRVNLDGIKMLYRFADTSESVKLQFDTCYATFRDIRIDSAATADTDRIFFARGVNMRFRDLKFRSPDSTYKLKAEEIQYSSQRHSLVVSGFKIQPTRKDTAEFYRWAGSQKMMTTIQVSKAVFDGLRLDRFLHNEAVDADSVLVQGVKADFFLDRNYPPELDSKVGKYPHQVLLRAPLRVHMPRVVVRDAAITYTERSKQTGEEGKLVVRDVNGVVSNVTNDGRQIKHNNLLQARLKGVILGSSPVAMNLTFYLDSANGRFNADGWVRHVSAPQLNGLAGPLASTYLPSFDVQQLSFALTGDDFTTRGEVRMRYRNLSVVLQNVDKESGRMKKKKFLTRLLNRFMLYPSNPGADGVERTNRNVVYNRTTTQSFFGMIWGAIFSGMEGVMMRQAPSR